MKKRLKLSVSEPSKQDMTLDHRDARITALEKVQREVLSQSVDGDELMQEIIEVIRQQRATQEALRQQDKRFVHQAQRESASLLVPATNPATRALRAASHVFALVEIIVPKRVASEEIGDALEVIARLLIEQRPVWQIYVKLVATVFWILAHAVRDVVKGPAGQKASVKKR